jgi:oligosaccharide repeat unit polymerase
MIVYLYILIPFLALVFYNKYKKVKDVGYIYLIQLFLMGIFAVIFYQHKDFKNSTHYGIVTLIPLLYWFCLLFIWIYPFCHFKFDRIEVEKVNFIYIKYISYFFIFISFLTLFLYFPHIGNSFNARTFIENKELAQFGDFQVTNIRIFQSLSNMHSNFRNVIVFMFFYIISFVPKQKGLKILMGISSVLPIIFISLAKSIRIDIVYLAIYVVILFFIFKPFLNFQAKKYLLRFGVFSGSIVLFIIISFSLIRFVSDNGFDFDPFFYLYSYMGESILNFNTLMYDNLNILTDGNANFPYLKKILGLDFVESGQEYKDRYLDLLKFKSWFFYSFIGDLMRDLGHFWSYVFAFFVMLTVRFTIFKKKLKLSFIRLFLITLYIDFCMSGLFLNKYSGFHGNVNLFNLILFSILLNILFSLKSIKK